MTHTGGRPTSPWRTKVNEIVSDGEWHDWEDLIYEVGLIIPPEVAHRKRMKRNQIKALQSGQTPNQYRKEMDLQIATGRRFIVSQCLHNMKRAGEIEIDSARRVRRA